MAKIDKKDILTFTDRRYLYEDYVANLQKSRFVTGHSMIDEHIRGVAPGEVMTIIAYSGTFKSALLQNMLMDFGRDRGIFQLMFSMEMPATKCFERELQIGSELNGFQVEEYARAYKLDDNFDKAAVEGAESVLIVQKPRLNLDDFRQYLAWARELYGHIGCVGIDYMGLIKAEGKSIFERMEDLAIGIKEFAKEENIPVIILGQVNRTYAQSQGKKIEMDAAKGGGGIEAGADFILGLERTKTGDIVASLLKNRNGKTGIRLKAIMDPHYLKFRGFEPETVGGDGGYDF